MQQITTLEQYRTLPQSHQETLVLQHMAAMYNITQPIQQPVQPTKTNQQQPTPPTQGKNYVQKASISKFRFLAPTQQPPAPQQPQIPQRQ